MFPRSAPEQAMDESQIHRHESGASQDFRLLPSLRRYQIKLLSDRGTCISVQKLTYNLPGALHGVEPVTLCSMTRRETDRLSCLVMV